MLKNNFIAASANIEKLDEQILGMPIVQETIKNIDINIVMSNSFGFGGTNASLIFKKL